MPTCLTKCGRLDSNWHWNPCSYPSSPESLPRLDYTPPLPRQAQLRRVDRRNHRGLSTLNVWVAHMRIALSYNKLKYVTMRTHRLLCVSSSAERGDARALAQPPKSTLGENMICTIIIHTRHKNVNITTHKNHKRG